MADKERNSKTGANNSSQGGTTRTPASSSATGPASTTPSATTQTNTKSKAKSKKNKDAAASSGMAPSGAQIMNDPAGSSGQGNNQKSKKGGGAPEIIMRRPQGPNNTMEYRFDYVCNFMNIKKDSAKDLQELDFCLDDICRMDFIQHFVNLKELILNNQGIQVMEGIDRLKFLEKCWLTHNYFDSIKSFDKSRNLRELYIGYNRITKTSGLEKCIMLEKLWIDCNHIDTIVGLSSLERLEVVNFAGNHIENIGIGFDGLVSLSVLNLAANKIGNFKEVLNLNRLPCLSICTFNDPHYGDNPICNLCNYSTYVLYHLPRLYRLDTEMISDESKNFAEGTFMKKRMYYNMRIKTIQRNTSNIMKLLKICRKVRNFKIDIQISKLIRRLNEVQRELEERQNLPQIYNEEFENVIFYGQEKAKKNPLDQIENDKLVSDIESKVALINGRLHDKNEDLKELQMVYDSLRKKVYDMSEQNIHRLMTELETGGNIRFEEGKPNDKWFTSCVDLVRSRFNADQMRFYGITGIQVTRVTRIHNRFLRNRFEEKLEHLVDLSDNSYKRNLEYLFYGVDPAMPTEIHRAMEEGFRSQSEYMETSLPNCIPLVNSVASAEIARIHQYFQEQEGYPNLKNKNSSGQKEVPEIASQRGFLSIPSGQLLVCKVFLSKCVQDTYYPHFNPSHSPSEIWRYAQVDTKMYNHVSSVFRTKENDQKQRLWFVFDNALVLPEYLVEFDYVANRNQQNQDEIKRMSDVHWLNGQCNTLFKGITETQKVLENTYIRYAQQRDNPKIHQVHLSTSDLDRSDMGCLKKNLYQIMVQFHIKELLDNYNEFVEDENNPKAVVEENMPPDIPLRTQLDLMDERIIKNLCKENNLQNITYLNLFNNKIKKISGLTNLTKLKTLILSFNEIEEIEGLENCTNLTKLDLHNNFIRQIKNLEGKEKITYLDLTHNWIHDWSQIEHIRVNCSNLVELGMRCNPIATKKSYRAMIFMQLSYLNKLDGYSFSDKDKERVNDDQKTLSVQMIFDKIKDQRKNLFENTTNDDSDEDREADRDENGRKPDWEKQIEVLNLSHQSISIVKSLETFQNLRKLNLMDNNIQKIQGFENCKLLEELSLEKNKIRTIENIGHLKYLKKLDLGQNRIQRIQNLNQLESLTQLSLEDNQIARLNGFEDMQTLMELYLGNNQIDEIKEVINLKELQRLIILDISGNNLIKEENYRIYCIFHLRRLRVLDGLSIENSECVEAKETFAGRLTNEILEQRLGGYTTMNIKELDLTSCKLRDFDKMFDRDQFAQLRELNLSHNFFASLRGFGYLPLLRILKIKQNRLDSLFCKLNEDGYPRGLFGLYGLEVLDVSYNNLHDLYGIQLAPMKDLKILHASNNEITKIDYLEKYKQLRELDLSKNRIRQIDPNSFHNQLIISCLKLEDNGLRSLANIERLERLQAFHGGGNRLAEFWEVDRLADLVYLMEISLMNNPMTRKPQYRLNIIKKLQNLIVLDSKEITMEERNRIETSQIYDAQKAPPMIHYSQYPSSKVPVKLNSVNFDGVFNNLKYNMQEGQTPQAMQMQNKMGQGAFGGVQGLSINGQGQSGNPTPQEMGGMIQVQGMNMQMQHQQMQMMGQGHPGQMGMPQGTLQLPDQQQMMQPGMQAIGNNRFKMRNQMQQLNQPPQRPGPSNPRHSAQHNKEQQNP